MSCYWQQENTAGWSQENTTGYTNDELYFVNLEWHRITEAEKLRIGSEEFYSQLEQFVVTTNLFSPNPKSIDLTIVFGITHVFRETVGSTEPADLIPGEMEILRRPDGTFFLVDLNGWMPDRITKIQPIDRPIEYLTDLVPYLERGVFESTTLTYGGVDYGIESRYNRFYEPTLQTPSPQTFLVDSDLSASYDHPTPTKLS